MTPLDSPTLAPSPSDVTDAGEPRAPLRLFDDEGGDRSMARVLVAVTTAAAVLYSFLDLAAGGRGPNAAYAMFSGVIVAFAAWAAGPRIAEYLAPQVGAVAKAVGDAVRLHTGSTSGATGRDPALGLEAAP